MKLGLFFLLIILGPTISAQKYVRSGLEKGIQVDHRWKLPKSGPPELLLRISNTTEVHKQVHVTVDVAYQGMTREVFEADTCIRSHQVLDGKLNGILFISSALDGDGIRRGDVDITLDRLEVLDGECP